MEKMTTLQQLPKSQIPLFQSKYVENTCYYRNKGKEENSAKIFSCKTVRARLVQLVRPLTVNQEVQGSIPSLVES